MLEHIIPQDNWKRPCRTCVWEDPEYGCQATARLGYKIEGERTTTNGTPKKMDKVPCRFHITPDELIKILDPYYM